MKRYAWILLLAQALAFPAFSQVFDISPPPDDSRFQGKVYFTIHDVLLIELQTGQHALVQFTDMQAAPRAVVESTHRRECKGRYRWRYKDSSTGAEQSGEGKVIELYEETKINQYSSRATPLPGHDPLVRAGGIHTLWSSASDVAGYLYYDLRQARVTVLPSDRFDVKL